MNNNKDFEEGQEVQKESYIQQRVRPDGVMHLSKRAPYNYLYSPNTPYGHRKAKERKGNKGLSDKQEENIDLVLHYIAHHYSYTRVVTQQTRPIYHRCGWFVLFFDKETSNEGLKNLLYSFKAFDKSIKYILSKLYNGHNIKPYIIIYGLKKKTDYYRKIPCFDINIVCVMNDECDNPIFDPFTLVNHIYDSASKLAKERIEHDYWVYTPWNTLKNYRQLANYLKNQVDIESLSYVQKLKYGDKLPNTYVHIHSSLKKELVIYKTKFEGTNIENHREIIQKRYSTEVVIQEKSSNDCKLNARLLNNSPETVKAFVENYPKNFESRYLNKESTSNTNQDVIYCFNSGINSVIKPLHKSYIIKSRNLRHTPYAFIILYLELYKKLCWIFAKIGYATDKDFEGRVSIMLEIWFPLCGFRSMAEIAFRLSPKVSERRRSLGITQIEQIKDLELKLLLAIEILEFQRSILKA